MLIVVGLFWYVVNFFGVFGVDFYDYEIRVFDVVGNLLG